MTQLGTMMPHSATTEARATRVRLDVATLSSELRKFEEKHYKFGADAMTNDLWLEVDFGDLAFERAVVQYVKNIVAAHYAPLGRARVDTHC